MEDVLLFTAIVLFHEYYRSLKYKTAFWSERNGRKRVEKEMINMSKYQLQTDKGFFIQPIGNLKSCYRQCIGTPRQGLMAPNSRSTIILSSNVSPEAMDGLEEFSHIWITFQFHLNNNSLKEAKAFKGIINNSNDYDINNKNTYSTRNNNNNDNDNNNIKYTNRNSTYTFSAKITPPMLKEKKGVLATRSPHRPNPIGLTLAQLFSINKKTRSIELRACDLVDGTPILDIKPYCPEYDNVNENEFECKIPQWIQNTVTTRNDVTWQTNAYHKVKVLEDDLEQYYQDSEAYIRALTETLEVEVRSKFQTQKRIKDAVQGIAVEVMFDETIVHYYWKEERSLEIIDIQINTATDKYKLKQKRMKKQLLRQYYREQQIIKDHNDELEKN